MKRASHRYALLVAVLLALSACGGAEQDSTAPDASGDASTAQANGLTQEQLEKGIGPISEVQLGPIDEELAAAGEETFNTICSACHKMEERYVGPPLGDVLSRRTPEYVMNMMLNPAEMVEKHPAAKELLAQYMTPMPNQQLTQEQARAILEYLRQQQQAAGGAAQ